MFSIQYVVANALLRRRSALADFVRAAVLEPGVQDLASRVEVALEPSFARHDECHVEIRSDAATPKSAHAVYGRGWPQNPATRDDLRDKMEQCFAFAGLTAPQARSRDLMEIVSALEGEGSLRRLLASLEGLAWFTGEGAQPASRRLFS